MKKYEYCEKSFKHIDLIEELNKIGEEGWEAICIEGFNGKPYYDYDNGLKVEVCDRMTWALCKREVR